MVSRLPSWFNLSAKRLSLSSHSLLRFVENCTQQLPIGSSLIPLCILLLVYERQATDQELTLKGLYVALDRFSDVGIKNHLKRLEKSGWLIIQPSTSDGRVKTILCPEKLRKVLDQLVGLQISRTTSFDL